MYPIACSRMWIMWTQAFSAAILFGTIVVQIPRSPMAQSALVEFEQAFHMFKDPAKYNVRAARALSILTKLREKVQKAITTTQEKDSSTLTIEKEATHDELLALAGHTRVIHTKLHITPASEVPFTSTGQNRQLSNSSIPDSKLCHLQTPEISKHLTFTAKTPRRVWHCSNTKKHLPFYLLQ